MTNVLRAIFPDYQGTIRSVEAKASVSGNAEPSTVAFCAAVKSLLICRIIRAHSPTTDVAPRQPSNRYSPGTKHQDLELNARGSLASIYRPNAS